MRNHAKLTGILLMFVVITLLQGCTSISTDDLAFKKGLFYDAAGEPYNGVALLTVSTIIETGIGSSPTTATVPYKVKIRNGHAVAVKYSSFPLAPWSPLRRTQQASQMNRQQEN